MGYYKQSMYRGDYYRGDYYRGDPGLFDVLSDIGSAGLSIIGAAAPLAGTIFGGPAGAGIGSIVGQIAGGLGRALKPQPPMAATIPGSTGSTALLPSSAGFGLPAPSRRRTGRQLMAAPSVEFTGGGGGESGGAGAGGVDGRFAETGYVSRRMNALNPKALRRALRRASAFEKFARKTLRIVRPGSQVAGFKSGMFGKRRRRKACA